MAKPLSFRSSTQHLFILILYGKPQFYQPNAILFCLALNSIRPGHPANVAHEAFFSLQINFHNRLIKQYFIFFALRIINASFLIRFIINTVLLRMFTDEDGTEIHSSTAQLPVHTTTTTSIYISIHKNIQFIINIYFISVSSDSNADGLSMQMIVVFSIFLFAQMFITSLVRRARRDRRQPNPNNLHFNN